MDAEDCPLCMDPLDATDQVGGGVVWCVHRQALQRDTATVLRRWAGGQHASRACVRLLLLPLPAPPHAHPRTQAINYCQCGYRMCLWCWNQLMETAGKEGLPGRCPNCRTEYDKEKITMAQLDPDL